MRIVRESAKTNIADGTNVRLLRDGWPLRYRYAREIAISQGIPERNTAIPESLHLHHLGREPVCVHGIMYTGFNEL